MEAKKSKFDFSPANGEDLPKLMADLQSMRRPIVERVAAFMENQASYAAQVITPPA